eukprot:TRINITY_DN5404_c0_g3_i1.p2 TRINITY_DN5404_c0_g3~~TRINITY_DN5404_c0_g3_i1.p2  ORF type:complete len:137 (+),score=18.15 TRINITY_DN5404_c0_g3_i1:48-458(+)
MQPSGRARQRARRGGRPPATTSQADVPKRAQGRSGRAPQDGGYEGGDVDAGHAAYPKPDRSATVLRLYKTKICKNWRTNGACPYNQKCMFAHGEGELRTLCQSSEEALRQFEAAGVRIYLPLEEGPVQPDCHAGYM